LRAFFVLG